MSKPGIRNPVTAIAEDDATGEIADIFADIRETMGIPLITSIWRILVDVEDGLRPSWDAAKRLYETGLPQAALLRIRARARLPVPEVVTLAQLASVGVSQNDLPIIRAILDAYNRSNGLNLVALTALSVSPAGHPAAESASQPSRPWPQLPPLPGPADIPPRVWTLLQDIHNLSAVTQEPGIATVWRHLAHWPGLLGLIHANMAPLAQNGTIQRSMQRMQDMARTEGARIAHLRTNIAAIPDDARHLIAGYAMEVHHIVTIGHGVASWLEATRNQVESQARAL